MENTNKKYKLLTHLPFKPYEDIEDNTTLYPIEALRDFGHVRKGDVGGYIQSEENLSHEGNCWVHSNCYIINSKIMDNAQIHHVSGERNLINPQFTPMHDITTTIENSTISGNAMIFGHAYICGSTISGNTIIHYSLEENLVVNNHTSW